MTATGPRGSFAGISWPVPGRLARSTVGVLAWNVVRLASQFFWLVLLARVLGVADYGWFAGAAGLAVALGGLTGLGQGLRMYRDGAQDLARLPARWSEALGLLLVSGPALAILMVVLVPVVLEDGEWAWIGWLACAEIVVTPLATQVAFAWAAAGRIVVAAAVPVLPSVARLAVVAVLVAGGDPVTLDVYAPWHFAATGVATAVLLALAVKSLALPWRPQPSTAAGLREGLAFSGLWATGLAFGSLDKPAALRWGGDALAGNYAIAQRLGAIAATPVEALAAAALPRMFGEGRIGTGLLGAMLLAASAYGILAGAAMGLLAQVVPRWLGDGFAAVATVGPWFAAYVPLFCVRQVAANVLLGLGSVAWRTGSELVATVVLVALLAWRVPAAGFEGAMEALVASEALLLAACLAGVVRARARDTR